MNKLKQVDKLSITVCTSALLDGLMQKSLRCLLVKVP